ncbi:hypothetical protein [Paraburkholderia diazotrophica]|uniref:hypothetical protein n=1 Tax=Paraburkholderia diazotrophica TaxID=667676 RepID=UPI00316B3C4B
MSARIQPNTINRAKVIQRKRTSVGFNSVYFSSAINARPSIARAAAFPCQSVHVVLSIKMSKRYMSDVDHQSCGLAALAHLRAA